MEYQVPQFIEVESKIVGPLTLKQFIYLAGGAGLCILFFVYLPIIFAFLLSAPIVALAVALSFYKVNGKPFAEMLEAGFNYYTGAKLFLWKHAEPNAKGKNCGAAAAALKILPRTHHRETYARETLGTRMVARCSLWRQRLTVHTKIIWRHLHQERHNSSSP